jgi:hypothetical protein
MTTKARHCLAEIGSDNAIDILEAGLVEPAWDPRVLLTLETRMEHEQETTDEAVSA